MRRIKQTSIWQSRGAVEYILYSKVIVLMDLAKDDWSVSHGNCQQCRNKGAKHGQSVNPNFN